jgi:hypothetical protein
MAVRFKQTSPLLEVQYSSFPSWIHCRERVWKKALNSRKLCEDVSARSGTGMETSYNAAYGVLPGFLTFCTFLFYMPLDPEKRPAGPPKSKENPENRRRRRLKGAFSCLQRPWRVVQRARSSGSGSIPRPQCQTTMDDDLENVQRYPDRYPVELWPEPQLVRAALSLLLSFPGALPGGRGSGKREAGEDRGGLIELAYRTGLSNWEDTRGSSSVSNWQGWCLAASRSARPSSFPVAPGLSSSSRCCSGDRRGAGRGEGAEG